MTSRTRQSRTPKRYAAVAATTALVGAGSLWGAAPASAETDVPRPETFTSAYTVMATPGEIIDPDGNPADGQPGASGTFDFMINSDEEIICYDITLDGVTGDYESMAKTATHLHAAAAGESGPPRIAFPDPQGAAQRTSSGCFQGPFTTGLDDEETGEDTGTGFTLAEVEADPAAFTADTHTADFVAGAVRGQLTPIPIGAPDTGMGGASSTSATATAEGAGVVAATGLAAALAGGLLILRRRIGTAS